MIISFHVYSQGNTIKHIVDRGETLASVAKLYCTTTERIVELNPDASDLVYAGMELDVPYDQTDVAMVNMPTSHVAEAVSVRAAIGEACKEADELLGKEEYSKAAKVYSKIIKTYKSSNYSCVDAYYGRALAYYNQSKWKSSIKDFECALADSRCTGNIRSHCTSLLASARKYREEQLERRGEIWGSIISTALVTTSAALVASHQAKSSTKGSSSYQGGSYSSGGSMGATSDSSDESASYSNSSSSKSSDCPSLKASHGKYYCSNTGTCAMCHGDGLMSGSFGQGADALKCTLCGGSGKCKYCQ